MILYRPVGLAELRLIAEAGSTRLPLGWLRNPPTKVS